MQDFISKPLLQARRIVQTNMVVQKNALQWLLGKRPSSPELLRQCCEDLGTTYIKLGQLVASMPSVFPADYVSAFQGCLDQTNPLPYKTIKKILQKELGDPNEIFIWIDEKPLASASIAQVHAARLATGEEVVIKVQRPDAKNILTADLSLLHIISRALEFIAPKLKHMSLANMIEEIKFSMLEECDFLKEAANIALYQNFLNTLDTNHVRVPKVYPQASTSKVLTMERFYGVPLTDINVVKNYHPNPEQALLDALNVWFASVNQCRIYHADLHSGNIMMLDSGQIGFIDFGIVGSISPEIWQALLTLGTALPMGDFTSIAQALLKLGATEAAIDTDALAAEIESLYRQTSEVNYFSQSQSIEQSLDDQLVKLSQIAKRYGIRFPRTFTLLIKQFLYFDRYIQALAPELDLFNDERLLLGQTTNH